MHPHARRRRASPRGIHVRVHVIAGRPPRSHRRRPPSSSSSRHPSAASPRAHRRGRGRGHRRHPRVVPRRRADEPGAHLRRDAAGEEQGHEPHGRRDDR